MLENRVGFVNCVALIYAMSSVIIIKTLTEVCDGFPVLA